MLGRTIARLAWAACASSMLWNVGHTFAAEVRQTDDYVAVIVEAEEFDDKDDRWVLTGPSTPAQELDPDPNHSATAVGQFYLELLPDSRVTHEDPFPTEPELRSFWGEGQVAPRINYTVNFPEAGRYHVHVRGLSTGTEDNGLHIGLNGTFPDSGQKVQLCSAGRGWWWTSRQRESGGAGSCGTDFTVWIDVENPGLQTLNVSPREDGFELDRLMLIKDTSAGTRRCNATGEDSIRCVNGAIPSADGDVNIVTELSASAEGIALGDSVILDVSVRNEDNFDTATGVELTLGDFLETDWALVNADERCTYDDSALTCDLGDMEPSESGHSVDLSFELQSLTEGLTEFTVVVGTNEVDTDPTGASDAARVDVRDPATQLDVQGDELFALDFGESAVMSFLVSNIGDDDAADVVVNLDLADALELITLPAACSQDQQTLVCEFDNVRVGRSAELAVTVNAAASGVDVSSFSASAANAAEVQSTLTSIIAAEPEPEPEVAPEPDAQNPEDGVDSVDSVDSVETPAAKRSGSGAIGGMLVALLGGALLRRRRTPATVTP